MARLMYIASEEGFVLDSDAASLIARIADGAMRDALSLLDQCVAYSNHIDLGVVSDAAGIAGRDYLFDVLEAVADCDISLAISKTDELYSKSKDMTRLCDELLFQTRNLMLIKTVPQKTDLLACLESEAERLKSIADKMSLEDILARLDILQDCSEAMQKCVSKRTEFEMALVKLCTPRASAPAKASPSADVSALVERINQLEREVARLKKSGVAVSAKEDRPFKEEVPEVSAPLPKAEEIPQTEVAERKVCHQWEAIIERLTEVNPGCAGALRGSKAYTQGNYLLILVKNKFFLGLFKKPENAASLRDVAKEITGVTYSIRAKCDESMDEAPERDPIAELIEKAKNADIPVDIN